MKLTSGDAEMRGEFLKTTAIEAESGDVLIDTALARAEYGLDLRTDGDITIEEQGREPEKSEDVPAEVKQTGGPHMINANASSGDIEIHFGTGSKR